MNKIVLTADSTCDLGGELCARYGVEYAPLHVVYGQEDYLDGVTITPDRIYERYEHERILPSTAAVNIAEYMEVFNKYISDGYEVVHVSLGRGLSASYNNCRLAAAELTGVHVIDSCSLSSGSGHLVIQAAERIAAGMPAAQVTAEVQAIAGRVSASFIVDTLEYLHKGGRCSALARLGANVLQLKPCIEVNNKDGSMSVGKKYRGSLEKVLEQYVHDRLSATRDVMRDRIFITHSGISGQRIELVRDIILSYGLFDEIFVTRAGCTVSTHCGPNTLGILFITNH